jgi:hypothetical protein
MSDYKKAALDLQKTEILAGFSKPPGFEERHLNFIL